MSDEHRPGAEGGGPPRAGEGEHGHGELTELPVEQPRRASLTLRRDDLRAERLASMEAANRSLNEALRLTYRGLQVLMVALVGVFLLTGIQQVEESERGLRVTFGAITGGNLEPGAHFNLPRPMGEIVKVPISTETAEVDRTFVPSNFDIARGVAEQSNTTQRALNPERDGSLLTADLNLAHGFFTVRYTVSDPASYAASVGDEETAKRLVRGVARHAMVRVAARTTIDDLLRRTSAGIGGEESTLERRVRDEVQASLDAIGTGLRAESVSVREVFPPLRVYKKFTEVNEVDARANREREEAEGERRQRLLGAAGTAWRVLVDLIDAYEAAIDRGDENEASAILADMDRVLSGELAGSFALRGEVYEGIRLSGEASQRLNTAQTAAQQAADEALARARTFEAALGQLEANGRVYLAREWAAAMGELLSRDDVQALFVPPGPLELRLNDDPEVARERDVERNRALIRETDRARRNMEEAGIDLDP